MRKGDREKGKAMKRHWRPVGRGAELVQACLAVGLRQTENGVIKAAVEEALLAREEGTPSANDICISMSN